MTQTKDVKIVDPEADDALALAKMHVQSWHDTYTGMHGATTEWIRKRTVNRFNEDGLSETKKLFAAPRQHPESYYFKLAKIEDKVVGFVSGQKTNEEQELSGFYVARDQQGTGLASKLMDMIMSWFNASKTIVLFSAKDNIRAIKFYEKYGFKVDNDAKVEQKYKPLTIIQMTKQGDKA